MIGEINISKRGSPFSKRIGHPEKQEEPQDRGWMFTVQVNPRTLLLGQGLFPEKETHTMTNKKVPSKCSPNINTFVGDGLVFMRQKYAADGQISLSKIHVNKKRQKRLSRGSVMCEDCHPGIECNRNKR